jgi:multicomponent Na+:H+ antiporter subunit E
MSRLTLGVFLLAMWLLLWGEWSVANLAGGVLVVTALFLVFPSDRPLLPTRRVHPLALVHLVGYFLVELVLANVSVTRSVLGRAAASRSGMVDVDLCSDDPGMITLITTMTALTPGSVMVEVHRSPPTARVHAFGQGDPARVASTIRRLEELCIRAVGDPTQRAALRARAPLAHGGGES